MMATRRPPVAAVLTRNSYVKRNVQLVRLNELLRKP
jgi:hypothetical protein